MSVGGAPPGIRPASAGKDCYQDQSLQTADELSGFGARSLRLAGLPEDYPVNALVLLRLVWFLRHNSKGKAGTAILSMELAGYWKPLIRKR